MPALTADEPEREGLCQLQLILGILDDDERVALLHVLVVLKANLLDKSSHTGIQRRDVPPHLCIVGIFHVAPVHKTAAHIAQGQNHHCDNRNIIYSLYLFLAYHNSFQINS